jgi:phosphoglycolate phosphatase
LIIIRRRFFENAMTDLKTRPRKFDHIAFDWDGTLFDSTGIIVRCIQAAVRDVGGTVPTDQEAAYVIGLGLMQALAHAAPDVPKEKYPLLGDRYRHHYYQLQDDISLFAGVVPMLQDLRAKGFLLSVATGKSRRGLDAALQRTVDGVELHSLFDASRTADQTRGKPDPLMLNELMADLGVDAGRTLMIGDTTHDLQLALNAGCASVGVSYGAHPHDDFVQLKPRFIAHSVRELHDWLIA